jgi:hypothetical protein
VHEGVKEENGRDEGIGEISSRDSRGRQKNRKRGVKDLTRNHSLALMDPGGGR